MNDMLKWVGKVLLQGVLWVFILSIHLTGRGTLFTAANDLLVQNTLVQTVDEELGSLWTRLSDTAKLTFSKVRDGDQKAM